MDRSRRTWCAPCRPGGRPPPPVEREWATGGESGLWWNRDPGEWGNDVPPLPHQLTAAPARDRWLLVLAPTMAGDCTERAIDRVGSAGETTTTLMMMKRRIGRCRSS